MEKATKFSELKKVIETLHGPSGCLWDKKQTHKSLIPHLREEVREFISAVNAGDNSNIKEELGDLLLHVMFNSQIASKSKKFGIEDVIEGLIRKLKRRHPHVFGNTKAKSARQIILNWKRIKETEKRKEKSRLP